MNGPIDMAGETIDERSARSLVRPSRDTDVEAMLAIYRRHIRHGVEEASRTAACRSRTICATGARTCAIAAFRIWWRRCGGEVVGYAYVVLFRKRPAYRYTVKHSIYVHHDHVGRGIGRLLMQRTDRRLRRRRLSPDDRLYRCRQHRVAGAAREVRLREVGLLPGVAYRYGRWADTVMVQRSLAAARPRRR